MRILYIIMAVLCFMSAGLVGFGVWAPSIISTVLGYVALGTMMLVVSKQK